VIQMVKISNFRGLKDVNVRLRPLTVLIGPNDSGKTSFLEAIFLRLKREKFQKTDSWLHSEAPIVETLRSENNTYEGSVEIFDLPSQGIPMESDRVADQSRAPSLDKTGKNLAGFMDYLLRKERRCFDQIQKALQELVPGLKEIHIDTPKPATRALSFVIEDGFRIEGRCISTGVRTLVFFVALAHHPNPPDVVLLEEPENGVHPKRLGDIIKLIRRLTQGTLGEKAVQIILTTHSPYLLDHIRLPDDRVVVFRRESDGRRTAMEADESRLKDFLDEFMLGEVWFNQGEEGLLKVAAR
jgi:predicted ATPase